MVVIGAGTFGKVYLARMIEDQPPVAIKALRKMHVIELNQVEHLKNEKEILQQMDNPFCVSL